ncbi:MAG: hypothetical protein ACYC6A_17660 [Armatimonadota bacterium]
MKIRSWSKRRKWLFFWAALILLAGIGWFLSRQPWTIRRIPTVDWDPFCQTSATGFIARTSTDTLTFYDWRGKECWRIKLQPPDWIGWQVTPSLQSSYDHTYSISRDGADLATATPRGSAFFVQHWRAGKRLGEVTIPCQLAHQMMKNNKQITRTRCQVSFFGDNQVLIRISKSPKTTLVLLDQGQLIARGEYDGAIFVASDGNHLYSINNKTKVLFSLAAVNGSISLRRVNALPRKVSMNNDPFVISNGGNKVTISSTVTSSTWTVPIPEYILNRLAVSGLATMPGQITAQNSAISINGQYVALLYYPRGPEKVRECLQRWGMQANFLHKNLDVAVFNRMGVPVARKRFNAQRTLPAEYMVSSVEPVLCGMSPDGKALLVGSLEFTAQNTFINQLTLYRRW